jgi:uncharacterized protein (DUF58 family)
MSTPRAFRGTPPGPRAFRGTPPGPRAVEQHERVLRQLEILVTRKLDGLLHGDHQGLVPAAGSDPGEAREYVFGDDVRHMDWNLTARTTVPHIRDTIAERELETWLVVDRSPSMDFGTARSTKRDLATAAVAAFAFLANRAGNRTGAVLVDPGRHGVVPARGGRDPALALLHRLTAAPPASEGPSDLTGGIVLAERLARRRGLVVVVSDFLGPPVWGPALGRLGRRQQLVAVEVRDPREDDLPPVGLLTLVDPETGARVEAQTSSPRLRARFAEAAAAHRGATARALREAEARHVVLSTDRDWLVDLVRAVARWRHQR